MRNVKQVLSRDRYLLEERGRREGEYGWSTLYPCMKIERGNLLKVILRRGGENEG
jgi:hypothetical protein